MWQPLYGEIWDNKSRTTAHTSSRCGKVSCVNAEINSHFSDVVHICSESEGELPKKDVGEAERKILYWAEKENMKKVQAWQKKKEERKTFNMEQEEKEEVNTNINLVFNPKNKFSINFVDIDQEILDIIKNKKAIGKLKEIMEQQKVEEGL